MVSLYRGGVGLLFGSWSIWAEDPGDSEIRSSEALLQWQCGFGPSVDGWWWGWHVPFARSLYSLSKVLFSICSIFDL